MRVVRLAALFIGVGLMVAVAVGYVARSADLARDRDVRVEMAAEIAAIDLGALVELVDVTAALATDPGEAVDLLTSTRSRIDACATFLDGAGGGPTELACVPSAGLERAFTVDDGRVGIVGVGPDLAVGVSMSVDSIERSAATVASGSQPAGSQRIVQVVPVAAEPIVQTVDGYRVSSWPIAGVPGWSVAGSLPAAVEFDPAERAVLVVLASLALLLLGLAGFTLVVEHRNLTERATVDPLTKLPNRSEFEQRGAVLIQAAQRSGTGVCLMVVDLDGFKAINDSYGHHAGDEVLQVVGMRLRAGVRGDDIVARWGGDEFVLMLPGIDDEQLAVSRGAAVVELVGRRLRTTAATHAGLEVRASVGIALLGAHGDTLDELIDAADAAMYRAKRRFEPLQMAARRSEHDDRVSTGQPR